MTSAPRNFKGSEARFVLPVKLSSRARRDLLLRTGVEPEEDQRFPITDFMALSPEDRKRLVDLWDKVAITFDLEDAEEEYGPWYESVTTARSDGYADLQYNGNRWFRVLPDNPLESPDIYDSHYCAPGRTITAVEKLASSLDEHGAQAIDAMLAGAPLLDDVGDESALTLPYVLAAYEQAIALAERLTTTIDEGTQCKTDLFWRGPYEIEDDAIYICPASKKDAPSHQVAVLKECSPDAYQAAKDLLTQLNGIERDSVAEKLDGMCGNWLQWSNVNDAKKVSVWLKLVVDKILADVHTSQEKAAVAKRYEECRSKWIARHGSQRLRRAAARGYRHDGIYRDERLSAELPDFVGSIGRKPDIRDLVNPSADALELEAEVLARAEALGIADDQIKLVYARPSSDSDWLEGAFVQIESYLGRHTVWRSVSGGTAPADEDIPF